MANGPPHGRPWPQRSDLLDRFVEQPDVGVTKPVDRLFPVPDHEDRRRRIGHALALAPGVDEQLDQAPLQAARVLKFVDEHMVIAGLQLQTGAGELLLALEQGHRPVQHRGKVHEGVIVEQPLVDARRHGQHVQQATGQQTVDVDIERGDVVEKAGGELTHGLFVASPCLGRGKRARLERLAQALSRSAGLGQEVALEPQSKLLRVGRVCRGQRFEGDQIPMQAAELRHTQRAVVEERGAMQRRLETGADPRDEPRGGVCRRLGPLVTPDEG